MKSNRTWAEFHAQGLLLGMYYDATDHTFYKSVLKDGTRSNTLLDADTMNPIVQKGRHFPTLPLKEREGQVNAGLLGASDWLDTLARHYFNERDAEEELMRNARLGERPLHGEDGAAPGAEEARSGDTPEVT